MLYPDPSIAYISPPRLYYSFYIVDAHVYVMFFGAPELVGDIVPI